ncbi:MAG: metallophosphoesterase [Coriobacteriia bacterium]|nr:metallophosphoesterase [Coriobacteriia bacterium]
MSDTKPVVIAQISDLHCGSIYYRPELAREVVREVNELRPDVVAITGDLTDMGFHDDFLTARELIDGIECERVLVVPGNHDARNVGEVHFEELFGRRDSEMVLDGVRILGVDSSEPDLDSGRVGRERYRWIEERFADPGEFKILCIHHHLVPVPGTGRERNIVLDAGDLLRVLSSNGVDLVLCGHKHVPNVWRLEDMFIVNAGTACSVRLRGREQPCYNIVEVYPDRVKVTLSYPFGRREVVADFRKAHRHECRWRPTEEFTGEGLS